MWLRDYLPQAHAYNARILTYGYSSHITGDETSMATLGDLSSSFLGHLINMRDDNKVSAKDSALCTDDGAGFCRLAYITTIDICGSALNGTQIILSFHEATVKSDMVPVLSFS